MPAQTVIQLRRDTGANWSSVNPVLAAGEVGYDSTSNQIKIGNGTIAWNSLAYASGGASVIVSATAPASPEVGDVWFNTENGVAYVYYDDFWTSISGASGTPISSDTPPTNPTVGMQWFNSTNGKTYLYYSNAWIELDSNGTTAQPSSNAIINGAFEINQRVFTSTSSNVVYTFDRWKTEFSSVTATYSAQAFAVGEAPSSTVGGTNFIRVATSAATGSTYTVIRQEVEDVRSFAGQVVTLSFWAKSSTAGAKVGARMNQEFGSGGSTFVATNATTPATLTSSWDRYSFTIALPSISGKTIGAGSSLSALIMVNDSFLGTNVGAQNATIDLWGVQLEAGAVATPFKRNSPNIQAELAACQRYYQRWQADTNYAYLGGFINPSNVADGPGFLTLFTPMRTKPTSVSFGNLALSSLSDSRVALTNITVNIHATASNGMLQFFVVGGLSPGTLYKLQANNSAAGFIALSAEL
jgi:hypothetical protein